MKYFIFSAMLLAGSLAMMMGCMHTHSHEGHSHGDDAHAHALETPAPFSFTVWTDKSELFVEFPPLVVGMESSFAAHFTTMENFKAIEVGKAMVCLLKNKQEVVVDTAQGPSSPGIFRLRLTPLEAGTYELGFVLDTPFFSDSIFIKDIPVYPNMEAALSAHPPEPEGDDISFLKEQAWKVDFATEQVKRQSIHEVIHTSGEFQPVKGEETLVSAKRSGIVFFKNQKLQEGRDVRAGETLFSISSEGLLEANLEEKFQVAKARLDKSKADFERAEELLAKQIIGQKEYESRKMEHSVADAQFQTLTNGYNRGGQAVVAPMAGIIKNVLVSDGQFVREGMPLVEITRNRRLLLQAEVSQQYLPQLRNIKSANFKTPYQDRTHSIDEYNGKLVSYGKMLDAGSSFIPVLFELDNLGELIPGSFAELFLLTNPIEQALVVPKSALMQDYSLNYVYVQTGGESYEKREVELGVDDGVHVQVLEGLTEGEWIVTKGAYQIKMASMSATIPAHGHEH